MSLSSDELFLVIIPEMVFSEDCATTALAENLDLETFLEWSGWLGTA